MGDIVKLAESLRDLGITDGKLRLREIDNILRFGSTFSPKSFELTQQAFDDQESVNIVGLILDRDSFAEPLTFYGVARVNEGDTYDAITGDYLAYGRAFIALGEHFVKLGNKRVARAERKRRKAIKTQEAARLKQKERAALGKPSPEEIRARQAHKAELRAAGHIIKTLAPRPAGDTYKDVDSK